jgi:peptidoglycan/LPS O-acetylase OafA/YrhL
MAEGGTSNGSARIAELDGIRAMAILAVLACHVVTWGFPNDMIPVSSKLDGVPSWLIQTGHVLAQGYLGVDLFFVLSGFLITGILLGTRTRARYFQNFYLRRALRILPVFLIALALMAAWYRSNGAFFLLALGFASDLAPLLHVPMPHGPTPLWSLAVEEQFYLVWPVLVLLLSPRRLAPLAAAVVVAVPVARLLAGDESLFTPWLRFDGIAFGALVAMWTQRGDVTARASARLALAGVSLAGILLIVDNRLMRSAPFGALRITEADLLFAALILVAFTMRGSRWMAVLRSRPANFVATTSYCAYIIHGPIFDALQTITNTEQHVALGMALRVLIGVPLTFAVAALSWRYLESPVLHLKSVWAPAHEKDAPLRSTTAYRDKPEYAPLS